MYNYNIVKTYKGLENSLTLFHFGIFSLALSLLIEGSLKVLHVWLEKDVSLGLVMLFFLSVNVKMGVLLVYSKSPKFMWGAYNKLAWLKYATVGSIVAHGVALTYIVASYFCGVEGLDTLLIPSLVWLVINLSLLCKENKKVRP
jgi:hypothetical protein